MSPAQKIMIENNLGVIRKIALGFMNHQTPVDDSWQYAVACHAVCESVDKWNPKTAKFNTFIGMIARYAIINEMRSRKKMLEPTSLKEDMEIPINKRITLDVPYNDVFKIKGDKNLRRDIQMFRRSIEGETVSSIVRKMGITRTTFYNRIDRIKKIIAKHAVPIK